MENYRKKLSVYFALFGLFSLWFIQAIFLLVEYTINNIKIEKLLEKKYELVYNISINQEKSLLEFTIYYFYFIMISAPFYIFFYYIGYYFVGENFKPIKETIGGLEDFTYNINHEMKTPLSEIISTLSLAKKTGKYDEAITQSLESSKKLSKILDSMLGIVNLVDSSYKKERFEVIKSLNTIIKEYGKEFEKKEIILEKNFPINTYYLTTNKQHFEICVGNILKNAIKYSDNKSIINIYFKDGVLELKDHGIGISKKNLKNIYDRYFRENYSKEEGYGIGLALVKKIVDLHSWKITIKSQKKNTISGEKGTIVKISFI